MSEKATRLEEALSLALGLTAADRLKLVEQVVSSVEAELSVTQADAAGSWGAEVVALSDELDMSDWERMDIPDVGEWVRQLRHRESERNQHHWKNNE